MEGIGVDISTQESKKLQRYLGKPFEYVITVSDEANEPCPVFPGATNRLHWSFEDPHAPPAAKRSALKVFRKVRDQIRERIERELAPAERDALIS
jgi:arsenate reductase (thioredoxin)